MPAPRPLLSGLSRGRAPEPFLPTGQGTGRDAVPAGPELRGRPPVAGGARFVYLTLQKANQRVPGMRQEEVFEGIRTPAIGSEVTSVKVKGKRYPIGLTVDALSGSVLTMDGLEGEDAETLKVWLQWVAKATSAEILVADDADAFKEAADELGLGHQIRKSHVQRNMEQLVEELKELVRSDADGSLWAIGVSPEQAVADLDRLK